MGNAMRAGRLAARTSEALGGMGTCVLIHRSRPLRALLALPGRGASDAVPTSRSRHDDPPAACWERSRRVECRARNSWRRAPEQSSIALGVAKMLGRWWAVVKLLLRAEFRQREADNAVAGPAEVRVSP